MKHGRVLLAGAWEEGPGYPRTSALREGLLRRGVECVDVRAELPTGGALRRKLVRSPWLWPGFAFRMLCARQKFVADLRAAVQQHAPDAVIVPYPGHLTVAWVRSAYKGPVVLDLFLSAYNTVIDDRRLYRPGSLPARLFRWLDKRACAAANLVLMDTANHAEYLRDLVGAQTSEVDWVPIGFADEPDRVAPLRRRKGDALLEVLFFGTGVPLHGLDLLIEAVAAAPEVKLVLVGGSESHRARAQSELGARLELCDEFVGADELSQRIEDAHLIAGIFGASQKAGCVVPFKVVHALAAGRPVITMDSPAVRNLLEPEVDCLVSARDPQVLAARLSALAHTPETLESVGRAARVRFEETFSLSVIGERLCRQLSALVGRRVGTVNSSPTGCELEESRC